MLKLKRLDISSSEPALYQGKSWDMFQGVMNLRKWCSALITATIFTLVRRELILKSFHCFAFLCSFATHVPNQCSRFLKGQKTLQGQGQENGNFVKKKEKKSWHLFPPHISPPHSFFFFFFDWGQSVDLYLNKSTQRLIKASLNWPGTMTGYS